MPLSYQWQQRINRWKAATGFGGGGGNDNQPRPKLCPACNSLVGISAKRCHECGANLRFSLAALSKGLSGFFGGQAPASTAILIVNVIMFAASVFATLASAESGKVNFLWSMGGDALYRLGASNPWAIFVSHEWFRVVTAMFLHIGVLHIGMNMMVLLDIGPIVEELYGSPRFLFLYVVTGAAGFLLSASRGHAAAGASGAIMGIIGAMIAITTKRSGAGVRDLRGRLISWVVTIFALGLVGIVPMDNWGHFGGLAAGFIVGKIFADRAPMNPTERKRAYALGWIAGAVLSASFALMVLHYRDTLPWEKEESANHCWQLESKNAASLGSSCPAELQSGESMEPFSIIIVSLHTPKEKLWGQLLSINPSGITMRGIDLNSFDHFVSQINSPDSERTGLATLFFPMNRVERIALDESSGAIPSLSEMFARKVGRPISEYLAQFA